MDKDRGWEVPEVIIQMWEGTGHSQLPAKRNGVGPKAFLFFTLLALAIAASALTAVGCLWKEFYESGGPLELAGVGLMFVTALAAGSSLILWSKVAKAVKEERCRTNFEHFLLKAQKMLGLRNSTWINPETGKFFERDRLEKLAGDRLREMGGQIVRIEQIQGFLNSPTLNEVHDIAKGRFEDVFHWLQGNGFISQDDDYGTYIKDPAK